MCFTRSFQERYRSPISSADLCSSRLSRSEMRHAGKRHGDLLLCMHAEPPSESETSCVSYILLFNRVLEYMAFVKSSVGRFFFSRRRFSWLPLRKAENNGAAGRWRDGPLTASTRNLALLSYLWYSDNDGER